MEKDSYKLMEHVKCSEAKYELIEEPMNISGKATDGIFILFQWLVLPYKK